MKDLIRAWNRCPAEAFALATLVRAHGSSYRQPGARMLIDANGATTGSLSGGCLEDEVAEHAAEVRRTGNPKLLHFDTMLRYGCPGALEILVEPLPVSFFAAVAAHLAARQSCTAVTSFRGENPTRLLAFAEPAPVDALIQEIQPALRLILFGDGPDSPALRTFAAVLSWEIVAAEQASELSTTVDRWTAALIKSHNYGRDFAALRTLLPLPLRYVGLIGSRRRRDQLLVDVLDGGTAIQAELFAPAGLHLGAETPEEIALSIIAEIQRTFAGGTGETLRTARAALHRR